MKKHIRSHNLRPATTTVGIDVQAERAVAAVRPSLLLWGRQYEIKAKLNDYCGDDYPRTGCKVVIEFEPDGKYSWSVYAPGHYTYPIESYFPKNIGSIGVAMAAFARGDTIRSVLPEMNRAEAAYKASGSKVTA